MKALFKGLFTGLRYLWASPEILVGLIAGLLFWAVFRDPVRFERGAVVIVVKSRFGVWMASRHWGGYTLGATIFLWVDDDEVILHHELIHVRQCLNWGPLMVPYYLYSLCFSGYRANYFEEQAYRETAEWVKANKDKESR